MDVNLIPRSYSYDCPGHMHYKAWALEGPGSCSCEDHCGWDVCRLEVAPLDCIAGTYSEWQWDYVKHAWVAQITLGNIALK